MSAQFAYAKNLTKDQPPPQWRGDIDTLMKSSISLVKAATPHMENVRAKKPPACYGRVKNLESMVPAQWWKSVFADAMYLKTDGDVVEDPDITKGEIALLEAMPEIKQIILRGSQPDSSDGRISQEKPARILDLCCGQGRHSLHLVKEYPHLFVHGHDQSSYLISLAQERASFQSVTTQSFFTVGDCRQIPYSEDTFDLVLVMGNSFGYFSNEDGDRAVLAEIKRVLAPGGRVVVDLTDGEFMRNNFAEHSWEWIDDTTFVCRERQLSEDRLRLISREIITVSSKGVVRDQFYQERLYSKTELQQLFVEAGMSVDPEGKEFADNGIVTIGYDLSKRKEDLGMMAQRMLVTAFKPRSGVCSDYTALDLDVAVEDDTTASGFIPSNDDASSIGASATTVTSEAREHPVLSVDQLARNLDAIAILGDNESNFLLEKAIVLMGDTSMPCVGKLGDTWNQEDIETRKQLVKALYDIGYSDEQLEIIDTHKDLVHTLSEKSVSFVLNFCDEGYQNDALKEMHIPALLDMANIQYSGAGPNCLTICYDKGLVNSTARTLGVPTPREMTYLSDVATSAVADLNKVDQLIREQILYPAFIKPIKGDNSLGITSRSIIHNKAELASYMDELSGIGIRDVLVQEYLTGTEYGIGMVGNSETGFHFFPTLKVDYSKIVEKQLEPILGYESKWDPSSPYWSDISYVAANLSAEVDNDLRKACVVLWKRFGCRDYARFDFRSDVGTGDNKDGLGGTIKLLEVNPNPGWCWDGKLAYMAKLDGIEYKDMLRMIIQVSWTRIQRSLI
ncbi:hypothetical protein BATDEDRAFT_34316 [Batrachochytrium dendrobatidis JAM81]|uniref:ATP-grasp domain-containing protein n=2 Tax=Batrachochytrium dendrobatidis TaxID=109871 RepID=F4NUV4_BATDJ|nr:uncharacterized protein BATDEDRAFT_34316 [Batrachochytrium dendrobatidis JAM81]KAJ8327424.1 hypothetical protein O5D80_004811 [Batrachochytrium dendrobatidis]OAJ37530.1 hypothetical protein BDEG_21542 [Batrachochytrium dendrobatidis JEL423]EGF84449.1 hypothetical protein BATDEDRAFT_34316 [Batrachochytrium dendrobatidis JAM81]KAK5665188.1 hypothetical protein QVD99_008035 [Batrachochytrium dendrobatidis]OAJ37531.1 hypothetical protein, variant [Batrachochytrium dendrobatidis JEL423]|eukprot:XP_006675824.1 hypothetical protein BATDEDRAFT_34316 [Batrachochytrium dendrobatidis JAM81]